MYRTENVLTLHWTDAGFMTTAYTACVEMGSPTNYARTGHTLNRARRRQTDSNDQKGGRIPGSQALRTGILLLLCSRRIRNVADADFLYFAHTGIKLRESDLSLFLHCVKSAVRR